jgi:DNA-binding transcriptional ArsR family regulator
VGGAFSCRQSRRYDPAPANTAAPLEALPPAARHHTDQYANNRIECDRGRLKAWLRPLRGLKQDRSAKVIIAGQALPSPTLVTSAAGDARVDRMRVLVESPGESVSTTPLISCRHRQLTLYLVICKLSLTCARHKTQLEVERVTSEELLAMLAAVGHLQRLRVIAELAHGRIHVSELARRLELSRPLLYLHLERLEKAGLISGQLELSSDGRAMKYFELAPFDLHLNLETILAALAADEKRHADPEGTTT